MEKVSAIRIIKASEEESWNQRNIEWLVNKYLKTFFFTTTQKVTATKSKWKENPQKKMIKRSNERLQYCLWQLYRLLRDTHIQWTLFYETSNCERGFTAPLFVCRSGAGKRSQIRCKLSEGSTCGHLDLNLSENHLGLSTDYRLPHLSSGLRRLGWM